MMADPQFTSNRLSNNIPQPGFKITAGERASLWFAFASKLGSEVLFLLGKRLAGRWLGYRIDRLGCVLHERAFTRTMRLLDQWEARK
ncbi:MAG: hypothetical protein L0Z50_33675 [Verrucomicrobiales bacterium]|nr:hypothetical protein [Verrucomicrobiales bacterium]